jgi:hypothetical protein
MDRVFTVIIGLDKKHKNDVLRYNPEEGENGRVGEVLFKNQIPL